jgi:glutamate-1-semialdehyde aminotransferase
MKKIIFAALLLGSIMARADQAPSETWTINGHVYTDKAMAVSAVIAGGKQVEVIHTRCEQLTNGLTFKACPKNKAQNFKNLPFQGLKVSQSQ